MLSWVEVGQWWAEHIVKGEESQTLETSHPPARAPGSRRENRSQAGGGNTGRQPHHIWHLSHPGTNLYSFGQSLGSTLMVPTTPH